MAEVDKDNSEPVYSQDHIVEIENDGSEVDVDGKEAAAAQQDAADMRRLGKKQELKVRSPSEVRYHVLIDEQRSFHSFSILGLAMIVMNTWMAIIT